MFDIIVIGAGPAGMAAGLCAVKSKLKTLVIAKEQPVPKADGFDAVSGKALQQKFRKALATYPQSLELKDHTEVVSIEKNVVSFSVETRKGEILYCRSLIIATGKSDLVFDLLTYKDGTNRIKVNAKMKTNVPGIFAAGEANDAGEKNLAACVGEGAKAALSAMDYLGSSTKY